MAREDSDGSAVEKDVGFEIDKELMGRFLAGGIVESRTSAGADDNTSSRFSSPLIKPDVPVSSIRLSDGLHRKAHAIRGGGPSRRTLSSPKIR